jgi:hypothetical protein
VLPAAHWPRGPCRGTGGAGRPSHQAIRGRVGSLRSNRANARFKLRKTLNTDDCQALYDKAIAAGAESVTPRGRLDRWPVTMAYIKDYDGYLVELVEYHEGTPYGVPDPRDFV